MGHWTLQLWMDGWMDLGYIHTCHRRICPFRCFKCRRVPWLWIINRKENIQSVNRHNYIKRKDILFIFSSRPTVWTVQCAPVDAFAIDSEASNFNHMVRRPQQCPYTASIAQLTTCSMCQLLSANLNCLNPWVSESNSIACAVSCSQSQVGRWFSVPGDRGAHPQSQWCILLPYFRTCLRVYENFWQWLFPPKVLFIHPNFRMIFFSHLL